MKKLISLLLTLAMVLSICVIATVSASAADVTLTPAETLLGTGAEDDPFLISTAEEFEFFRLQTDSGNPFKDLYVELTSDIDLGGAVLPKPVMTFSGHFDGKGHTISNFSISAGNVALFQKISKGSLRNLKVDNAVINATSNRVGGIVAIAEYDETVLENLEAGTGVVINAVKADVIVGGVVGFATGGQYKNLVSRATVNVNVTEGSTGVSVFAGGVIGAAGKRNSSTGSVVDGVINYGTVTVNAVGSTGTACAGGVFGSVTTKSTAAIVSDAINFGKVTVIGDANAAGFAGGVIGSVGQAGTEHTFTNIINFSTEVTGTQGAGTLVAQLTNTNGAVVVGANAVTTDTLGILGGAGEGLTIADGYTTFADPVEIAKLDSYKAMLNEVVSALPQWTVQDDYEGVKVPTTPIQPEDPEDPENPKTGDALGMTIAVAACAIVMGSAAAFVLARKKENA